MGCSWIMDIQMHPTFDGAHSWTDLLSETARCISTVCIQTENLRTVHFFVLHTRNHFLIGSLHYRTRVGIKSSLPTKSTAAVYRKLDNLPIFNFLLAIWMQEDILRVRLQNAHPLSVDNLRICQYSIFSRSLHCIGLQENIPMGLIVMIDCFCNWKCIIELE